MSTVPPEGTPDPAAGQSVPPPYQAAPPAYGQPAYGAPAPAVPLSQSDERLWATLSHVGGILFGFLAPLIIWLVFKDRSRFVEDQGKEALNFQILVTIAYIVGSILIFVIIGFFILLAAWILAIVFGIQGAIRANKGEAYRYPLNWRIVK